jgi:signal transduction histidine kinase
MKIILMKRNLNEICSELIEYLSNESNTLLTISTGDKQIRHFAVELNKQLRILRKQRQQYLSGDRELKEAVTNISHDLRTPLTAICGYLELLEGEEKSASVKRYIDIINNRIEALKHLTEELFQYSVILASENDTVKEKIVLGDMIEESIAGFYAVLKEHGINPNIQLPQNKVVRYLNPTNLSRVLSNLLNNAIKYSDGDLDITLTEAGNIKFTNTASGLNEVQVGKLFDRFYTVEAARDSTGLGLAITRTLIEQMNGTISAEYENNKLSICILLSDCSQPHQM